MGDNTTYVESNTDMPTNTTNPLHNYLEWVLDTKDDMGIAYCLTSTHNLPRFNKIYFQKNTRVSMHQTLIYPLLW